MLPLQLAENLNIKDKSLKKNIFEYFYAFNIAHLECYSFRGQIGSCKRYKVEDSQEMRSVLTSSSTPPGNLGFSARQTSSLPSSSLLRTKASLLTVELLLCVVDTLGSPITCSPSLQMILAAGELPHVSHLAAIGRPAKIWSSLRTIFTIAGLTKIRQELIIKD